MFKYDLGWPGYGHNPQCDKFGVFLKLGQKFSVAHGLNGKIWQVWVYYLVTHRKHFLRVYYLITPKISIHFTQYISENIFSECKNLQDKRLSRVDIYGVQITDRLTHPGPFRLTSAHATCAHDCQSEKFVVREPIFAETHNFFKQNPTWFYFSNCCKFIIIWLLDFLAVDNSDFVYFNFSKN